MGPLRALEFYSGMGGMHCALKAASPSAVVVAAFDISEVANRVYSYNFGAIVRQGNVGKVSPEQLDSYDADIWLMAPPCQPYTRQGHQKGAQDARAHNFLEVLRKMERLKRPPEAIVVENVVGFERSGTHAEFRETLERQGYDVREFVLSPEHYSIPYSRPRYLAAARKVPFLEAPPRHGGPFLCTPSHLLASVRGRGMDPEQAQASFRPPPPRRLAEYLEAESGEDDPSKCVGWMAGEAKPDGAAEVALKQGLALGEGPEFAAGVSNRRPGASAACCTASAASGAAGDGQLPGGMGAFLVPKRVLQQSCDVIDVVVPSSTRCNCFTKSYTRFARGTGSVLAPHGQLPWMRQGWTGALDWERGGEGAAGGCDGERAEAGRGAGGEPSSRATEIAALARIMVGMQVRYLTPREIANLHGFPSGVRFPRAIALRQRYALLGNSLNVEVLADVVRYALDGLTQPDPV